jgi:hypothetical protein
VPPEDAVVDVPPPAADVDVDADVDLAVVVVTVVVGGGGVVPPLIAATWSVTRLVHSLLP